MMFPEKYSSFLWIILGFFLEWNDSNRASVVDLEGIFKSFFMFLLVLVYVLTSVQAMQCHSDERGRRDDDRS